MTARPRQQRLLDIEAQYPPDSEYSEYKVTVTIYPMSSTLPRISRRS